MVCSLGTPVIKDPVEQPDEEIGRVKSGRALSTGGLSPGSWSLFPSQ